MVILLKLLMILLKLLFYSFFLVILLFASWFFKILFFAIENNTTTLSISARTKSITPFLIDPSHPFYIHASNNTNTPLVSSYFDRNGLIIWRRSILVTFSAKNKLDFILGCNPQPSEDSLYYLGWDNTMKCSLVGLLIPFLGTLILV